MRGRRILCLFYMQIVRIKDIIIERTKLVVDGRVRRNNGWVGVEGRIPMHIIKDENSSEELICHEEFLKSVNHSETSLNPGIQEGIVLFS
jgi:hypothetical protein